MSNLEIGYDEHEGKRRRRWWNKIFGLFLIAPIGSAVLALALAAGTGVPMMPEGSARNLEGSEYYAYRKAKNQAQATGLGVGAVSFLVGLPLVFNGWMSIMKDDG
jgi:hypothetical protein